MDFKMTTPRFDWSFNFGHVLQTLGMALTVGGGIWWTSAKFENFDARMTAAESRASVWVPRVEALQQSDHIQNERIGNISNAIQQNRDVNVKMMEKMSLIGEDLAAIKARMSIPSRN